MCIPALSVWNNENDMRIVEVQYDEFAVVHTIKTKEGVSEVLNKLYSKSWSFAAQQHSGNTFCVEFRWIKSTDCVLAGRTQVANAKLRERFSKFSEKTGILTDNIVILPENGKSLLYKHLIS